MVQGNKLREKTVILFLEEDVRSNWNINYIPWGSYARSPTKTRQTLRKTKVSHLIYFNLSNIWENLFILTLNICL